MFYDKETWSCSRRYNGSLCGSCYMGSAQPKSCVICWGWVFFSSLKSLLRIVDVWWNPIEWRFVRNVSLKVLFTLPQVGATEVKLANNFETQRGIFFLQASQPFLFLLARPHLIQIGTNSSTHLSVWVLVSVFGASSLDLQKTNSLCNLIWKYRCHWDRHRDDWIGIICLFMFSSPLGW